ncbi:hypothetical protein BGW41_005719 [Actinomortierella wolfii]|nr:hypothetical protein BGW41_005719 [Actinomortierella wolfii]
MAHLLSILATLLVVAFVQAGAALDLLPGVYSIAINNLYLTTECVSPDAVVFLSAESDRPNEWMVLSNGDGRYRILDATEGYTLGLQHLGSGSQLTLTTNEVFWELYDGDGGQIEIRVPHRDLVVGMLPSSDSPPLVGLTNPAKAPHSWMFELIRPMAQKADLPRGNVQLILSERMFITQFGDGKRVRLMPRKH